MPIIGRIYFSKSIGEHHTYKFSPYLKSRSIKDSLIFLSSIKFVLFILFRERVEELKERRRNWSRSKLEASGLCLFDAAAEPETEVFGEKIIKIYKYGETRLRDRFTRGDVLVLTPETAFGGVDPIPKESLVVDVGKDWMTLAVGANWPNGLWEMRRTAGAFLVRFDRTASQVPLRAQMQAIDCLRKNTAGDSASLMANLFINSTEYLNMASQVPSHFDSENLESQIAHAMKKVTESTKFEPNQSQKDAISWSLQRCISLIRGPPGTGKTRVAALLIATALQLKMNKPMRGKDNDTSEDLCPRILAVAHSNGAADVLLEGLLQIGVPAIRAGRPASVSPNVQHRTVVAISEKMPEVVRMRQQAADNSLDSQIRKSASFDINLYLSDVQEMISKTAPVIVTSCIGAKHLMENENSDVIFPIVVLDEAAQTTEPGLLCALAAARARQVILVGDTRQLPPTVTSVKLKDSIGTSPMARLESINVGQITLKEQYRMPAALLEHPSKYFYNGLVTCAKVGGKPDLPSPKGFPWPSSLPLAFIQTGNDSEVSTNFGGKTNPTEVEVVKTIVSNLIVAGEIKPENIAVISPYSKQVQLISSELSASINKGCQNVQVGTVDSMQGQETDVVIFSAVRSNLMKELGFLRDSRRLNVAITRAKRGLIIVGDRTALMTCRHWGALLESFDSRKCSMDVREIDNEKHIVVSNTTKADRIALASLSLEEMLDSDDEFYGLFD